MVTPEQIEVAYLAFISTDGGQKDRLVAALSAYDHTLPDGRKIFGETSPHNIEEHLERVAIEEIKDGE